MWLVPGTVGNGSLNTVILKVVLTGTRLHAGRSKAELPVRVGFGLKGGRVVDGRRRTVLLTHTAVVEVTTSLQWGRTLNSPPKNKQTKQTKPGQSFCYLPGSRSLWVRCIQRHTACGSSRWEENLCIAGSPTHSCCGSLWWKSDKKVKSRLWVALQPSRVRVCKLQEPTGLAVLRSFSPAACQTLRGTVRACTNRKARQWGSRHTSWDLPLLEKSTVNIRNKEMKSLNGSHSPQKETQLLGKFMEYRISHLWCQYKP